MYVYKQGFSNFGALFFCPDFEHLIKQTLKYLKNEPSRIPIKVNIKKIRSSGT